MSDIAFGLAGAVALLYSSVLLVREARLAIRSNLQELAFVREAVLERNAPQLAT